MSQSKGESFSQFINRLQLVPVSISYEYDPCDEAKAKELYIRAQTGTYRKAAQEDFESIARGITGYKGRIHLSFGDVLNGNYDSAVEVANAIDREIINNYKIFSTNRRAEEILNQNLTLSLDNDFDQRIVNMAEEYRSFALDMYANICHLKRQYETDQIVKTKLSDEQNFDY